MTTWIWLLFFGAIFLLYNFNLTGWLMHDDEGTDFYEAWQLSSGAVAGVDFIAEQQPLFLYSGGLLINLFGRDPLPLRLLSALQILTAAVFFGWVVNKVWGGRTAALAVAILLISGPVFEQARLYRPDPMMFAWGLAGLSAALLAVHSNRNRWWAISGLLYGLSFLWKPFAVFPVFGLIIYFLFWFWQKRTAWQSIFISGVTFALPFLAAGLGLSTVLYAGTGFYYGEPFSYHLAMGGEPNLLLQIARAAALYLYFFILNWPYAYIALLWLVNGRPPFRTQTPDHLLLTQLLAPLIFAFVSRPLHHRYLLFLIPALSLLLANQFFFAADQISTRMSRPRLWTGLLFALAILFILLGTTPRPFNLLLRSEEDTLALADYVNRSTNPEDIVIADYAGINFFADRQSIYEASIIAGAQIDAGIVNTALLIERIETEPVAMVLIHLEGGEPHAHQLIVLDDFPGFIAYLETHFGPPTEFVRDGQLHAIYQR